MLLIKFEDFSRSNSECEKRLSEFSEKKEEIK